VILSDEEIEQCAISSRGDSHVGCATRYARAIETAVIAKLTEQEPVSYQYKHNSAFGDGVFWSHRPSHNGQDAIESMPLYAHPMPK
jgi:hypothetical protein